MWPGWTLDSFDFTIFLPVMLPIPRSFQVSFLLAPRFSPETRGKELAADVVLA